MRFWALVIVAASTGCAAPTWPEGAELVQRERSVDVIGVIWSDATNASTYIATIDGQSPQEIAAPNVEARFEGLEESHLYLVEVRARNMMGDESEPLTLQVRTRDGTPPEFPEGAELSYELTNAARFWWPEASDTVGVVTYVLRGVDDPETELKNVRETEVVYDEPPPPQVEVVAVDAAGNESEPLRVTFTPEESAAFEARRLEFHQQVAEDFEISDATTGNVPEGINPGLLRDLVEQRHREQGN